LAVIPEDRLLLETDCPYMTPVPFRGTPNEPKNIPLVAAKMAELKGLSGEEIERVTTENALRFYSIKL
jgi:TatD DNase family protein